MAEEDRIGVHQFRDQQFGSLGLRALQPRGDSLKSLRIPGVLLRLCGARCGPKRNQRARKLPSAGPTRPDIPAALSEASQPRSLASNRIRLTVEQGCELDGPNAVQRTAPGAPLL
jgi:hypothetical protein